jgi:hypothetical protein
MKITVKLSIPEKYTQVQASMSSSVTYSLGFGAMQPRGSDWTLKLNKAGLNIFT